MSQAKTKKQLIDDIENYMISKSSNRRLGDLLIVMRNMNFLGEVVLIVIELYKLKARA